MEKLRSSIKENYKWDLSKIYKTNDDITKDICLVSNLTEELVKYKKKICLNSNNLTNSLTLYFKISRILDKLIVYANMKYHEDMSLSSSYSLVNKINKLSDNVSSKLSFVVPEILKQKKEVINNFIKENKSLQEYKFTLNEILKEKPHTLSESKEKMLAKLGDVFNISSDTYEVLDAVSLTFDDIDLNGTKLPLNQSNYSVYLKDLNRELRKEAFKTYYKSYENYKNVFAQTLYGNIKTDFFISNERNYKSPLQMYLSRENISPKVYDKLLAKVNERLDLSHKYISLRKKVLNLKEMNMYDIYVPLVSLDKTYSYEDSIKLVKEALSVLGSTYINDLTKIIDNNLIDVYHNKNKQTGAYSWGCYDSMPYILLNFEGTFNDVSTIAHELGHSMHSYYSNLNNPYQDSSYTIFLAEIASTVNEILLNSYMSKNAKTKNEKLFYLNNLLEIYRTTLIRQTMFAEFQKLLYEKEEQGISLTTEEISNTYLDLNKKYYGNNIISDPEISLEWARISHFYKGFYVYKYATGISIASKIAENILNKTPNFLDNYLLLLKSGGKDIPTNLLKLVNIDIENDDTIDKALDLFSKTLKEFNDNL